MQQQQIAQQLQRTQQLCSNAANLCQQVVQELQQINQAVQNAPNFGYQQTANQFGGAPGYQAGYAQRPAALSSVMAADRNADIRESTPSNRNYNAQTPAYSQAQSANYTSQVNQAGIQAVMAADRQANTQEFGSSTYTSYGSTGGSGTAGGFQGGISSAAFADRRY